MASNKARKEKHYSKPEKEKILATAAREKFTGAQVRQRFGVSTLTFYRWRGPVRSAALARRGMRGPGRPRWSGMVPLDTAAIRREVQAQARKLLLEIIREEVAAMLKEWHA